MCLSPALHSAFLYGGRLLPEDGKGGPPTAPDLYSPNSAIPAKKVVFPRNGHLAWGEGNSNHYDQGDGKFCLVRPGS